MLPRLKHCETGRDCHCPRACKERLRLLFFCAPSSSAIAWLAQHPTASYQACCTNINMSLFLPRAARGAVSGAATIALAAHTSMPKSCAAATAAAAATAQNLRPTTTVGALLIAAVEPSELRWSATAVKAGGGAAPGSLHAAALSATTVSTAASSRCPASAHTHDHGVRLVSSFSFSW